MPLISQSRAGIEQTKAMAYFRVVLVASVRLPCRRALPRPRWMHALRPAEAGMPRRLGSRQPAQYCAQRPAASFKHWVGSLLVGRGGMMIAGQAHTHGSGTYTPAASSTCVGFRIGVQSACFQMPFLRGYPARTQRCTRQTVASAPIPMSVEPSMLGAD